MRMCNSSIMIYNLRSIGVLAQLGERQVRNLEGSRHPGDVGSSALIAFSRMYLFLHFPTDVLCGIIFGVILGFAADKLCDFIAKKKETGSFSDSTNC